MVREAFLPGEMLATLYDKDPSFSLEDSQVDLKAELEYRYVAPRVDYGETIRFGACLTGNNVEHLKELDVLVNGHISDSVSAFPVLKETVKYASIVGFLRWAREPGQLEAIDFYPLIQTVQHDPENTPTPDFMRNDQSISSRCLE